MQDSYILENRIVTEKSTQAQDSENRYIFRVKLSASKGAVAQEVAKVFNVKVANVKTLIMPGKKRRIARSHKFRTTRKWKKAVVTLQEGQKIKEEN